jgi:WD40 repeat protein/flagellar biosynthesis GTPase FlhF
VTLSLIAPESPFKGLSPFDDSELDALFFFGRERDREVVVANLMASRLTVLFGPSGVGKTSLLRAGVAHALRPLPDAAVVVFSAWPVDPLHELHAAIAGTAGIDGADQPLPDLLAAAADVLGGDVYVILDQFEEYFLYHDPDAVEPFADELADAIRRPGLRANFLLGIREDALAKLDAFKGRIPGLFANYLRLDRLDRDAGEAAIVGPVNAYNTLVEPERRVELEPALVAGLLDEVTAGRVDLGVAGRGLAADDGPAGRIEAPYLQLVLERLWNEEARVGSRRLRLATLAGLGGASHIVHEHLDRAMAGLSPREQDAAAAMYNHLVTPSGTKIALVVADLAGYAALDEKEAAAVLRRLSAERIVRAGENGGSDRYEIYHDVLADAVVAWRTRYVAERRLEEQRREAERRHRRLIRILGAAFAALAIVAAVAIYALIQRSEAQHQTALAQAERANAEQQTQVANAARREAVKQKKAAQHNAAVAKQKTEQAQEEKAKAQEEKAKADASNEDAQEQRQAADTAKTQALDAQAEAEQRSREADAARTRAVAAAQNAEKQRNAARRARARATQKARIVRAKQLEADARAFVTTDPVRAVENALAAVRAYRRAGLRFTHGLEETVREAFLALRLRAVLPTGTGPARVAKYSPDGSLVVVAGQRGARIYDVRHRFAVHRLLPAVGLRAVDFSPDNRLLAGAGDDGAVHVWDASTGAPLEALRHDGGPVWTVAFSSNGELLASGGADATARLWSVAGGLPLVAFDHPAGATRRGVFSVSFSPDGRRLLTVGGDRLARVFDIARKKLDLSLNNTTLVSAAVFSHDGRLIATGSGANTDPLIRVWNSSNGEPAFQPLRGTGFVNALAFSPDDSLLAAAGGNDTIARVWNLGERGSQAIFPGHISGVASVAFSPDSQSVVSAGRDGKAILWTSSGGFIQATFAGHHAAVNGATFSPDGRSVLTAGDDGTARIWDAIPESRSNLVSEHGGAVNAVAFSPDGRTVLSAGSDGTARLTRGTRVLTLKHGGAVTGGEFSRDGRLVITGSADKTARVWSAANGALVKVLEHGAAVNVARLSPNGRFALTGGDDDVVRLWSVQTGRQLHAFEHQGRINDARFSRDGKLVVTASADRTAAVWRVADGRRLHVLVGHTGPMLAAVFSPGGRLIATASTDTTARIWDARTGALLHTLAGHTDDVTAVAFSPGGALVATSSLDRDARIWNARTGHERSVLSIHAGQVNDVAFSFDGRWVATAGPGAAGIWDVRKGREWSLVYLIRGHSRPINDVVFSPRGWRVVTGSRDGTVRSFDCVVCARTPQLAKLAGARLRQVVNAKP